MNRKRISDWMLTVSIALGLVVSPALMGVPVAVLVRGSPIPLRWRMSHTLVLLAAAWAVLVVSLRASGDSGGAVSYYGYLWSLPILLAAYKPDARTLELFGKLILGLFVLDLGFNVFSSVTGQDILGRIVDERDGLVGGRNGGLFAHSFYSGSISIAAFITLLGRRTSRWIAMLAVANLLLAGSWRLGLAIPLVAMFAVRWQTRSRLTEWAMIASISIAVVVGTVFTSGFLDGGGEATGSNAFRVFAWVTAIDKVATQPLLGVGFPKERDIDGISNEVIDENLIAESWYLGSAISFGIPYTLLAFAALIAAFYGRKTYANRDLRRAILVPFVMIDLTYGGLLGGILIYTWVWLLISVDAVRRPVLPAARPGSRTLNLVAKRRPALQLSSPESLPPR